MHTATPVDAYLAVEMAKRRIPGLAISVVKDGEVVRSQGLGLASIELDVPVTPGNRGFDPVNPWGLTIDVAEFYLSGGGPIGAGEST